MDNKEFGARLAEGCKLTFFSIQDPSEDMIQIECRNFVVDMGSYGDMTDFCIKILRRFEDKYKQMDAWDNLVEEVVVTDLKEALEKVLELCRKYSGK